MTDLCIESGVQLLNSVNLFVELVVSLSNYEEEGVRLNPTIYITNDVDQMMSLVPDREQLKIGLSCRESFKFKLVLKKCSPLALDGWLIYVGESEEGVQYGLFRGPSNPLSLRVEDVLIRGSSEDETTDEISVVKVLEITRNCIEVRSSRHTHHVFFDHGVNDAPITSFSDFVECILVDVEKKKQSRVSLVLQDILSSALAESHGCIIAVTDETVVPECLVGSRGVILDPPIDFVDLVDVFLTSEKEGPILSKKTLVRGMLNSDGITLFDTKARLLAFNCFIDTISSDSPTDMVGGARTRAFESLKLMRCFHSIFIASQDGRTDFHRRKNE